MEESHSITIRDARPDLEEGLQFAKFVNMAAHGFIPVFFGRDWEKIIAEAYIVPRTEYSSENVIVAEREGVIVGMASGFTTEQRRDFSEEALLTAAGSSRRRVKLMRFLFRPVMSIIYDTPDSDYYVLSLAVDKEARGLRIGSMLLDGMEERGRRAGCTRLALDVDARNANGRAVYEHRGMKIERRFPKRIAIPYMTFYRMTKPL
jgi:ribosomal protein S18 acetylase RimI-like enzyme